MAFERVNANDLRLGLYIKLVGSWFSHPFPTNTFKIKTEKDLETLRSLRNVKILYDFDRSDPPPTTHVEPEPEEPQVNIERSDDDPGNDPAEDLAMIQEKEERKQAFAHRRNQLLEAEQAYQEVLDENKVLMREVTCGYVKGMRKAEELMNVLGDILSNDGSLVALMNLMGNNEIGDEFYYHSLNTAILSMVVARDLNLAPDDAHMVGMAALFHDIGEVSDDGEIQYKGGRLTQQQQLAHQRHPQLGKRMLEKGFSFPGPSLDAIYQHHERMNGTGYPHKLSAGQIHKFAKIIMIVDAYDDLCNNIDLKKCLTPYEAMCKLYALRDKEFWEEGVLALIRCLGVYPPSSIVELSDGSIGIVSTINLEDRLRPMVMLYSQGIAKDQAILLDLSEEKSLSLKQCLRPSALPREIWEYLNPRSMIRYFAYNTDPGISPSSASPRSHSQAGTSPVSTVSNT